MESDVNFDKHTKEECYICGFICHPKRMLTHIRSHTHVEIFECEVCGDRFASKTTLQRHYITHRTHFICEHCNKKFVDPDRLRSHSCFTPEDGFMCEACGKEFVHETRWLKHVAAHAEEKAFKCEYCSKTFRYKRNLTAHVAKHPVDDEGQIVVDSKKQLSYTCDICDKEFPNKRNLIRHCMSHSSEKPYVCQVCNRGFALKHNMEVHERLHYMNERPHQCKKCGKCFSRRSNLKVHYSMHVRHELGLPAPKQNNGKFFPCDICQKTFISKRNLIQHQVTHTKEKPYVCQFCNQRFSYDSCLKRHSYLHTEGAFRRRPRYPKNRIVMLGPDGEIETKPYICHVCHAAFNEEIELRAHRKSFWSVNNYTCCKCFQVYKNKKKLKEHEKVHDIESVSKPVVCAIKLGNTSTDAECSTSGVENESEARGTGNESDTRDIFSESDTRDFECVGDSMDMEGDSDTHDFEYDSDAQIIEEDSDIQDIDNELMKDEKSDPEVNEGTDSLKDTETICNQESSSEIIEDIVQVEPVEETSKFDCNFAMFSSQFKM